MRRAMMRRVSPLLVSFLAGAQLYAQQSESSGEPSPTPIEAPDPGRISGKVLFKGKKPEGTRYDFQGADRARCGTFKRLYDIRVGDGSRLRGVLLWLEGVASEPGSVTTKRTLSMRRCEIQPRTLDANVGDVLVLSNRDAAPFEPRLRWLQPAPSESPRRRSRHMWIPHKEQSLAVPQSQPGLLEIHEAGGASWQTAWLRVFEHPYHVRSDDHGSFVLEDVPPGTYVLHAWDPKLGEAQLTVDVAPAKTLYVSLSYGPEGPLSVPDKTPPAQTTEVRAKVAPAAAAEKTAQEKSTQPVSP